MAVTNEGLSGFPTKNHVVLVVTVIGIYLYIYIYVFEVWYFYTSIFWLMSSVNVGQNVYEWSWMESTQPIILPSFQLSAFYASQNRKIPSSMQL